MEVVRDEENRVRFMVLFEAELCEKLDIPAGQLREWRELFPPDGAAVHPDRETKEPIFKLTVEHLDRYVKYAKILRTGMSISQVRELERKDDLSKQAGQAANMLDMYSLLAEECPPGVTAHVLRTYCVVFLYQNRGKKMLLARELARVAGIPEDNAKRHLRYLQAVGALRLAQNPTRWEFAFVPKALSKYYS